MKYFFDTEFMEGFSKWVFAKNRHYIDLISIGIVAEDGREYYAISNEFNPSDANDWVKENVLYPIMVENGYSKNLSNLHGRLGYSLSAVKHVQQKYGKSNAQIAKEICEFVNYGLEEVVVKVTRADCWDEKFYPKEFEYVKQHNTFIPENLYSSGVDGQGYVRNRKIMYNQPEFYAYYGDYDWVLFCSLFGRMVDLPKGFPMYCKDLKQELDYRLTYEYPVTNSSVTLLHSKLDAKYVVELRALKTLKEKLVWMKEHCRAYPKQTNEHNALSDAKWNKKLFDFINLL